MQRLKIVFIWIVCLAIGFSGCKSSKKGSAGRTVTTLSETLLGGALGGAAGAAIGKKMSRQKLELEAVLLPKATVETVKKGEALKVTFASGLLFMNNSNTLSDTAKYTLRQLAVHLNNHPDTDLKIIAHTDSTGKMEFNRILSERRARSVCDYLTAQGIEAKRMMFKGVSSLEPVAGNHTAEGRVKNRRLEIFFLAGDKMILEAQKTQ